MTTVADLAFALELHTADTPLWMAFWSDDAWSERLITALTDSLETALADIADAV